MKNTILKLTAVSLSALMFTACSSKKNDVQPEVTEEEPAIEQPFLELSSSDFKKIDVSLTHTDDPAPVEIHSVDVSAFDFGKKLPPCGHEDEPLEGVATSCYIDGKNLYFRVTYDYNNCLRDIEYSGSYEPRGVHEWSIFRYSTETEELKEVYSYSVSGDDPQNELMDYIIEPTYIVRDKLYFIHTFFDAPTQLTEYDPETQEEKVIYESADFSAMLSAGDGYIYIANYEGGDYRGFLGYDPESGEWKELLTGEEFDSGDLKNWSIRDLRAAKLVKSESRRQADLVTDFYRLETEVTNAQIIYTSADTAILYTDDNQRMHTYNIPKREYYVSNISDIGGWHTYSNDMLYMIPQISEHDSRCFMPESGLVMTIEGLSGECRGYSDDIIVFASYAGPSDDIDIFFIKEINWFEI